MSERPNYQILRDVRLGKNVRIYGPVNLYECEIGDDTMIGSFVEVQKRAKIGSKCKISSHSFICEGVTIEDEVFVGHGVYFTNDKFPRATNTEGKLKGDKDWNVLTTVVKRRASIGSGVVLLPDIEIGENALVGAGSVVTKSVPAGMIVAGNPAKIVGKVSDEDSLR